MNTGFQTFVRNVIDVIKAAPFATEITVEEYDGRYEAEVLKITGDETVCFVGLESISPVTIPTHERIEGAFFGEISLLLFVQKSRISEFNEDNTGSKTIPYDVAMEIFRYLYRTPITLSDDFILPQTAKENRFFVKEFSGFENIIRLPNAVVVGGTVSYPFIFLTEAV